ncbi:TolC family protein [Tanticharoenia sakaeratensis]|uniref:Cobalt/zinc/cadmium resistance heavy metal efflux pump protein CzcC n=1 Tax=Tanticharoenia sakaeratensis NBRC 103193 TaxID=1231623 RepID=A0A0D6MN16_9PROT|nr:TolC family protein [Tanticharoenia sakaeratensis]GAN54826.1 cobalt/zinc/cadmium resistance heavy metal efflux pump protein CzcC [Tanticharoenia sakaeratensis NBRC 103193]GBQ21440.1 cobalt/zinc/cadmium resistance heavy metal efflux p ump protein CzcC [Tanticharoenia sakaeratensis NBRC 103193]
MVGLSFAQGTRAETLHDAIQAAWALDPNSRSAEIDMQAAHRTANALDSWFPAGPTLSGEYFDDHFIGSHVGYTTYQGGISVPLWLPGQGSASVRNALADEAVARARVKVERLATAVRVLDLASTATALTREIDNLNAVRGMLSKVMTDTRRALRAGEIASADQDAVVAETEDLDSRRAERQQRLETACAELETLTGHDAIPDLMALDGHVLSSAGLVLDPARDPRIVMADAISRGAGASYELARRSYMPDPNVGVQVSRQEQYGSPWDTQIGVVLNVPLPSAARNTPMLMKEVRAMGAAERDATLARRKVTVEYRQTRSQLAAALDILRHSRATEAALDDRAAHLKQAWRVGETPIIEYLRARRAALDARQRASQADVIWHASMVRMMLMAGQTP